MSGSDRDVADGRARKTRMIMRRPGVIAVVLICGTAGVAVADVAAVPVRIAVFPFELLDFSAAHAEGSSPGETTALTQSTEEARQELVQSGRYTLVDMAGVEAASTTDGGLRACRACAAALARRLGAQETLVGVVTKISMTEYVVRLEVSDVASGDVVSSFATDLRIGADYSWWRGVRWLMKNRMLGSK